MPIKVYLFRIAVVLLLLVLVIPAGAADLGTGAGTLPPAAPVAKGPKPWFNAAKVCTFPLGGPAAPQNLEELLVSLTEGWKKPFSPPSDAAFITLQGGAYPSVDRMCIDLSNAKVNDEYKSPKMARKAAVESEMTVANMEISGLPVLSSDARIHVKTTASDVKLEMKRDKQGMPVLIMTDAKNASFWFDLSHADLEALLLQGATSAAAKSGFTVKRVTVQLTDQDGRRVTADLRATIALGFINAKLHLKGELEIDDQLNGKLTNLTADGDDILGGLVTGLIRPSLKKYENSPRPLVAFPAGRMKLRDISIRTADGLHVHAVFGS